MTTETKCEHLHLDYCGHGIGMIECQDCGKHLSAICEEDEVDEMGEEELLNRSYCGFGLDE